MLRDRLGVVPSEPGALPPSRREREIVERFAVAVEAGDVVLERRPVSDGAGERIPVKARVRPYPTIEQGGAAIDEHVMTARTELDGVIGGRPHELTEAQDPPAAKPTEAPSPEPSKPEAS